MKKIVYFKTIKKEVVVNLWNSMDQFIHINDELL